MLTSEWSPPAGYKQHGEAARRTRPRRRPRGCYYITIGAIDVRTQGAFRGIGDSVLKYSGGCAGHKIDQRLEIPVLVSGIFRMAFSVSSVWTSLFFGLQVHDGCLDGDLLGTSRPPVNHIAGGDGVGGNHQIRLS